MRSTLVILILLLKLLKMDARQIASSTCGVRNVKVWRLSCHCGGASSKHILTEASGFQIPPSIELTCTTSFTFTGTKIFPISVLGCVIDDNVDVEAKEKDVFTRSPSRTSLDEMDKDIEGEDLHGIHQIVTAFYQTEIDHMSLELTKALGEDLIISTNPFYSTFPPRPSNRIQTSTTSLSSKGSEDVDDGRYPGVIIQRQKPIYNSIELMEIESPSETRAQGKILVQVDEKGLIIKFRFTWKT